MVVAGTDDHRHSTQRAHEPPFISRKLDNTEQSTKLPDKINMYPRSGPRTHGQRRANTWRTSKTSAALRQKYADLRRGWKTFAAKLKPTHEELCSTIQTNNLTHHQGRGNHISPEPPPSLPDETTHDRDLFMMSEYLRDGGKGFMPEQKEHGWIRIGFENWNSLGLFNQRWKLDRLNTYIRQLNIDIIAGCETQTDWSFLPGDQRFTDIICPEKSVKGSYSHNSNERIAREQVGGTAIAAVGNVTEVVIDTGVDGTGLGRWSWICIGSATTRTYVVSAYLPHKASRSSKGNTAHDQQRRYFERRGNFTPPRKQFITDLLDLIGAWRRTGAKCILAIDANQDVYDSPLSRALAQEPYSLECMFLPALGERVPNSHFRGTGSITTVFGTPGLTIGYGMCYPHWFGIGDHRLFLIEVTAESVYGGSIPTICRPKSRSLNCRIPRICHLYQTRLLRLCEEHRMQQKLDRIIERSLHPSSSSHRLIQLEHDMWDTQFGQLMSSAEADCTKFRSCLIEHSPKVGKLLRRRQVLHWLLRYLDGKPCNKGNLRRACKANDIAQPFSLSISAATSLLEDTTATLHQLAPQAEALRREHLKHRLQLAQEAGHEDSVREILRIIRREGDRKRQRMINNIVRPRQGRVVTEVAETTLDGSVINHDNESSIISAVGRRLSERFRLGLRAPASVDEEISSVLGIMGDTETSSRILNRSYTFPSSWDKSTVLLMEEAAKIKSELTNMTSVNRPITPTEFSSYWKTAKETTSSSYSGRHFGHYKAASTNDALSLLHTTSINIAAQRGAPITRWKHGVTVLLQKIPGNNSIDRLRAICLLEADFNWWLKMIYTRRMMGQIQENYAVPAEQMATSGKTSIDGVMMKQLFYDRANVLHEQASLSSTDASNCYDAVNHPICSIALQAFGVGLSFIRTYLSSLQTMQFHLRTGYGLSEGSFGGSETAPFMGLTQGSGASPPVWSAVSTLIIRAYRACGHGPQFNSMWSNLILVLAAILFVDDTDLLHLCSDPNATEEDFVRMIQRATHLWTLLLQATGGNLKPSKCYWYFLSYTFDNGVPRLKRLSEIRHHTISIPQPDGNEVPIELLDVTSSSKTLGVFTCPAGDCTAQLRKLTDRANDWARRVGGSSLSPRLAWHSFHLQLLPYIRYGLVPIMAYPAELLLSFDKIYFKLLPSLGINRHIRREWRTLPSQYQGLGMPNLAVEKVAMSLQFLHRHWGASTTVGSQLLHAYEFLQLETGLGGHILNRDYRTYQGLASHSWFKILWSYIDFFRLDINLGSELLREPTRERDKIFMDVVVHLCPPADWTAINRVRKYKQVYFLSHLLCADGTTVDKEMLTDRPGPSRGRISFPREEPTKSDFRLWKDTLQLLTSPSYRYSPPLGVYIRPPMERDLWLAPLHDMNQLLRRLDLPNGTTTWSEYYRVPGMRGTRHSVRYEFRKHLHESFCLSPGNFDVVSIDKATPTIVSVHSRILWDRSTLQQSPSCLRRYLDDLGDSPIWNSVRYNGDGMWISSAIQRGTLVIVHDGSYMHDRSADRCSAGGVLTCTQSRHRATFSWCERTSDSVADNYRGELLGCMIALLILRAASNIPGTVGDKPVQIYCDNSGVVSHCQHYRRTLPEKQSHADLLRLIRQSIEVLPFPITYRHLLGHQDNVVPFEDLPLPAQMNVIADSIAKEALLASCASQTGHTANYPCERAIVTLRGDGQKVTSSLRLAIGSDWGRRVCRSLMLDRGKLSHPHLFAAIHWSSVSAAMLSLPKMYQVWVTKYVSHFCGTNKQLSRMNSEGTSSSLCPSCKLVDETVSHILRCSDEGRCKLFLSMVDNLESWLIDTYVDIDLATGIGCYLRSRGQTSLTSILAPTGKYLSFAHTHDQLGWDNFIEGRISTDLVHLQQENLTNLGRANSLRKWCVSLIHKLLELSHRQWLYRNLQVHILKQDHMTQSQHEQVLQQVETAMLTDPSSLLPRYRHLLETDFHALGSASSHARKVWLEEVDTAKRASTLHAAKRARGLEITSQSNLAKKTRLSAG